MKPKEIEAIESYITRDSEHWNEYALKLLCEVLEEGQFENPETPLRLYDFAMDTFLVNHKQPVKAVELFTTELVKEKLTPAQTLFIFEWVCKYLRNTEYNDIDLTTITEILKSKKEKLESESQPEKPLANNIRESLKELMQKELKNLPDTLKVLEPVQRLNILCKLIPYVLPKVESVHHEHRE